MVVVPEQRDDEEQNKNQLLDFDDCDDSENFGFFSDLFKPSTAENLELLYLNIQNGTINGE
ncbi:hypothetical protein NEOLI_005213 [Neolecta irregularis DAH-3]|uniref:Uncharacterized protein n=1 Tax=Neolecta irregularis (strain DAH-3) TaxID=1198029 RepID=A0A1U7LI61_NEOID|nr:hypothetical protein NEOLI_005213 [Neolecta irregularis DAH-3]|eukprot:OLL22283.1 hypothetical protein NEOLI_005213 [Neolecta irregularis DAH-3]